MFDYSIRFEAIDKISKKIEKINAKMNGLKDKANQTKQTIKNSLGRMTLSSEFKIKTKKAIQKLRTVRNKIRELKTEIRDFGLKAGAGGASLLYGISKAVNSARLYELAFKDVKKAVDGTPEQLQELRDKMKSFKGASFEELSSITAEAGKMGFNAKKVMGFTEAVIKGAKALDFNGELAVEQVGKILAMTNQMDRAVEAGQDIMDKVTNLENKMAGVKAGGVINVWKRNADLYAQLNFKNDSMGAMSAFLEQSYVSSELGASGFKMMINRFKVLESEFGFYSKIKEKGLAGIKDVMKEIAKMTPEQRIKKFGVEAMSLIDKLSNKKNLAKIDMALTISKSSKGAVEKEWQLFRATFDESLNDMKKATANMGDSLGVLFIPVIKRVASGLSVLSNNVSKFAQENPKLAKVIAYTTAILGAMAVVAGFVAVAMWAISAPVLAIIAVVALLVAGLVSLYMYWEDITDYLSSAVKSAFETIVAPIKYVIDLIDSFISKFEIYNKMKEKISDVVSLAEDKASYVGGKISSGWEATKNFFGYGENNTKDKDSFRAVENVNSSLNNKTVVEVKVTAENGAKAETKARSTGGVLLRNLSNGI